MISGILKKPISPFKLKLGRKKGCKNSDSVDEKELVEVEEVFESDLQSDSISSEEHISSSKESSVVDEFISKNLNIQALEELDLTEEFEAQFGTKFTQDNINREFDVIESAAYSEDFEIEAEDKVDLNNFDDESERTEDYTLPEKLEEVCTTASVGTLFKKDNVTIRNVNSQHQSTFSVLNLDFDVYRSLEPIFIEYNQNSSKSGFDKASGGNLVCLPMNKGTLVLYPRTRSMLETRFIDETKTAVAIVSGVDVNSIQTKLIDDNLFAAYAKEAHSENIRRKDKNFDSSKDEDFAKTKKLLVETISLAVQNGCTDVHLYLRENFEIRFRAKKVIQEHLTITDEYSIGRSLFNTIINDLGAAKCSGSMNYVDFEGTAFPLLVFKDKQKTSPITVELRIEKAPIDGGSRDESAGIFIRISKNEEPQSLEQLKIKPPMIKMFKAAMNEPQGMIIVTGPTGSGKTTLLHAILREMRSGLAARTIEDPVELRATYNKNITQMNIDKSQWQEALESVLRQDPDVVMLGEIRGSTMLKTLIQATLTGHLTLTTLHTNGAIPTLTRMIDIGGNPEDLATEQLLSLIIATRLNTVPCHQCALKFGDLDEKDQLTVLDFLGSSDLNQKDNLVFTNYNSKNCTCNRGTRSIRSMQEVIKVNDRIRDFIRNTDWKGMKEYLIEHGWKDFETQAREQILRGELDLLEVQRVVKISLEEDENKFIYEY